MPMPQEAANRVYLAATQEPVALLIHGCKATAAAIDLGCIRLYHRVETYFT